MIVGCINTNEEKYLEASFASWAHICDKVVMGVGKPLDQDAEIFNRLDERFPDKIYTYQEDRVTDIEGGYGEMRTSCFDMAFGLARKYGWDMEWISNPDPDQIFYSSIDNAPGILKGVSPDIGIVRTREWKLYPNGMYVPLSASKDPFHITWIHFIRAIWGIKYVGRRGEALVMPEGWGKQIVVPEIEFVHLTSLLSDEEMLARMIERKRLGKELLGTDEEITQQMIDQGMIPADKKNIVVWRRTVQGGQKLEKFDRALPDVMKKYEPKFEKEWRA